MSPAADTSRFCCVGGSGGAKRGCRRKKWMSNPLCVLGDHPRKYGIELHIMMARYMEVGSEVQNQGVREKGRKGDGVPNFFRTWKRVKMMA